MFFFFGWRTKSKVLGQFENPCQKCSRPTVHAAIEAKKWFTLFFIPVIPLGSKFVLRCGVCGLSTVGTPELKSHLTTKAMAARA